MTISFNRLRGEENSIVSSDPSIPAHNPRVQVGDRQLNPIHQKTTILNLPEDTLLHTFQMLDSQPLVALAQVNRSIRSIAGVVPVPSVVVDSPEELRQVLKGCEKRGITTLALEGNNFTYAHLETLPPLVRKWIRELSAHDLQIAPGKLADLKTLLPNLESFTTGCTARSPEELKGTLTAWTEAANANSCKVTIAKVTLRGAWFDEDIQGLPASVTELEAKELRLFEPKVLSSSLRKFTTHSGVVSSAALEHLNHLTHLNLDLLDDSPSLLPASLCKFEVGALIDSSDHAGYNDKASVVELTHLTQLTDLHVWDFNGSSFSQLPASLKKLTLVRGKASAAELTHLIQLTDLHLQDLSGSLSQLPPSVTKLTLDYGEVSISELKPLIQLTDLHVRIINDDADPPPALRNLTVKCDPVSERLTQQFKIATDFPAPKNKW